MYKRKKVYSDGILLKVGKSGCADFMKYQGLYNASENCVEILSEK